MSAKWSKAYWAALFERTAATFVGALITMLTADSSGIVSGNPQQWWVLVGLPTVLAALKGIAANLNGTGPSMVKEEVVADDPRVGIHRDESGVVNNGLLMTIVLVLLIVVLLVVLL